MDKAKESGMAEPVETNTGAVHVNPADMSGKSPEDYKIDKFKALYQCRAILSKHGTMEERRVCGRQLDRMKKLGINSV
jgi:hypothetical protein